MKIKINIISDMKDTEITVSCGEVTAETERLIAAIRMLDKQMTVILNDETHILDISKVMYVEAVDRNTFVYTAENCFESKLRLYEIEERLCSCGFLRISKSCLVNLRYIRCLKKELDRKLRITLENSEQIIVSRKYADELKIRLGVK